MINTILNVCGNYMARKRNKTWMGKLMDKEDNSVSLSSVLTIAIMLIAIVLYGLVVYAIGIEVYYNHTVASDINGWSLFLTSVTSLVGIAAGLKWGINHTDRKFPMSNDPYCDMPHGPGRFGAGQEETPEEEMIVEENIE